MAARISLGPSRKRALHGGNKVKEFVEKIGEKSGDRTGEDCTHDGSRGFLAFTHILPFAPVPCLLAVFRLPSLDCWH